MCFEHWMTYKSPGCNMRLRKRPLWCLTPNNALLDTVIGSTVQFDKPGLIEHAALCSVSRHVSSPLIYPTAESLPITPMTVPQPGVQPLTTAPHNHNSPHWGSE